jgi:CheY-like chemotaxis protein
MPGLDLLREVRRQGIDTPAIMVTGNDDESLAAQARSEGVRDVVIMDPRLEFLLSLPERIRNAVGERAGLPEIK